MFLCIGFRCMQSKMNITFLTINLAICSVLDADRVYTARKHELQIHPRAFSKRQKGNIQTCIYYDMKYVCISQIIRSIILIAMHQKKS